MFQILEKAKRWGSTNGAVLLTETGQVKSCLPIPQFLTGNTNRLLQSTVRSS